MQAANSALDSAGFGPGNFSVACYSGSTPRPTHAALHSWGTPAFVAAVKAINGVQWSETGADPVVATKALIEAQGAQFGAEAPDLAGQLAASRIYRYEDGSLWWTLQAYNASVFSEHPSTYPALIRRCRTPGAYEPWIQPLGAGYEYKLLDPFTGQPERCAHNGANWRTIVDNNVWEPGVYGWVQD